MQPNVKIGQFTGNGNSNQVNLGFAPDFVMIQTKSRNGGSFQAFEAFAGDSTGSAFLIAKNLAAAANPASFLQHLDTNGVTIRDGTILETTGPNVNTFWKGFKVGSAISLNGKVMKYIALRSGQGLEGNT